MITGMVTLTISASRQSMKAMNTSDVEMLSTPQAVSTRPHVTNSATRSVSEVTRDIIQPTGVLL